MDEQRITIITAEESAKLVKDMIDEINESFKDDNKNLIIIDTVPTERLDFYKPKDGDIIRFLEPPSYPLCETGNIPIISVPFLRSIPPISPRGNVFIDYLDTLKQDWSYGLKDVEVRPPWDRSKHWLAKGKDGNTGRPKRNKDKSKKQKSSRKLNRSKHL